MSYTPDNFANLASSTVAGGSGGLGTPLNPTDTTLYLPTGHGARFPVSNFRMYVGTEILNCTTRTTDTCTIVRGAALASPDTNTSGTWPVGTTVQQIVSAGNMANLAGGINTIYGYVATITSNTTKITNLETGFYNVRDYGAVGDGVTDDTSAINAAVAAGVAAGGYCVILLPPSSAGYLISAPLSTLSAPGMVLAGLGRGASWLKPSAGFSGAQVVTITADLCGVRDLTIAYSSSLSAGSGSNPTANGIQITGARYALLDRLELRGVNGWAIQSQASASQANFGAQFSNIHILHCASGIHLQSNNTGSNGFGGQHQLVNTNAEVCDTGDCLLIEDINDVWVSNFGASAAQGSATNSAIHVQGATSSIFITAPDVGFVSTNTASAPVILIETGTNGSPKRVGISNGVAQGGTAAIEIDGGSEMWVVGMDITRAATYGMRVTGSAGDISVEACNFSSNGQSGSSGRYDYSHETSGHTRLLNNTFRTGQGTTAGLTNNAVNTTGGTLHVFGNYFVGSGYTSANIFNGTPTLVKHNPGYNPVGSFSNGADPGSGNDWPTLPYDSMVYLHGGSGVTNIKVGGSSTGITASNTSFRIPAGKALSVTYTTSAPTIVWFGE